MQFLLIYKNRHALKTPLTEAQLKRLREAVTLADLGTINRDLFAHAVVTDDEEDWPNLRAAAFARPCVLIVGPKHGPCLLHRANRPPIKVHRPTIAAIGKAAHSYLRSLEDLPSDLRPIASLAGRPRRGKGRDAPPLTLNSDE